MARVTSMAPYNVRCSYFGNGQWSLSWAAK